MTYTLYRWARTPEEAAELQRDGWQPCEGALRTHHAEYAMLLRKPAAPDHAYTPAFDFDAGAHR